VEQDWKKTKKTINQLRRESGPRMLNLNRLIDLEEIWIEAERRIGTDRSYFALVYQSHYLEQVGVYKEPSHFLEVRYRGREAGRPDKDVRLSGEYIVRTYRRGGDFHEELRAWETERDIRRRTKETEGWKDDEIDIYRCDNLGYRRLPDAHTIRRGFVQVRRRRRDQEGVLVEVEGQTLDLPSGTEEQE
jgi:hypothetical protein